MRREDGDDNGVNGRHSGQDGHLASSSLALETPSAGIENANKWPLFTASKRYNSGVRNLLILPTFPLLDIASDAFCCRLCYILSCSKKKKKSKTVVQEQGWWTELWSKAKHDSVVVADIHRRRRKLSRNFNQWNEMKWTGKMTGRLSYKGSYLLCEWAKRWQDREKGAHILCTCL